MSIVWTVLAAVSLIFSFINGTADAVSSAVLEGAGEAVATAVAMTGPICLWSGICSLMDASGISEKLSRLMAPVLKKLFPETHKNSQVLSSVSGCVTANFLGLGNAATPLGIKAVTGMSALQKDRSRASSGMCRFIVLCTASIQLIPSTVAALRASLGCENPFDILPAVWISSIVSVAVGLGASWVPTRFEKEK